MNFTDNLSKTAFLCFWEKDCTFATNARHTYPRPATPQYGRHSFRLYKAGTEAA